jgi:MFS transporter, DHA2 family, integral membrane protein
VTASFFVMFGFFFLFSLYLQFARGYSPLEAGLATLPFAVAFVIVSPRSATLAERIGSDRTIAYGFAVVGLGMTVMGAIGVDTPYLVLVAAMVLLS